MVHWRASVVLCALLTGRPMPLCAWVGLLPDGRVRRAYCRAMDRVFEPGHVARITAAWAVGDHMRRGKLPGPKV